MTRQTSDDSRETTSFKIADQKIDHLLKRLAAKNVCPCCTARALVYHAASEAEREIAPTCARTTHQRPSLPPRQRSIDGSGSAMPARIETAANSGCGSIGGAVMSDGFEPGCAPIRRRKSWGSASGYDKDFRECR
jgi:hypothetical protein